MALLWRKKTKDTLYELRSAGNALRLYTDGVFHTQYNPRNLLTGQVWDLLMLPAFFYPPGSIRRVLVLGVGGGAAVHLLRRFIQPEKIVGVELNSTHVYLAKKYFSLKGKDIELHQADAVSWLASYQGEKFDMIIDDLFAEQDGEPVPVVKANGVWFSAMLKQLKPEGVIVRNFIDRDELKKSAALSAQSISRRFPSVYQFTSTYNENFVGAFFRKQVSGRYLRNRLIATSGLNPTLKTSRLRYKLRRLK